MQTEGVGSIKKTEMVSVETYERALQEIALLKDELARFKRLFFGQARERYVPENTEQDGIQMSLFDDVQEQKPAPETETITYTRKSPKKEKANPVRVPIPDHLPRKEEVIEPEKDAGVEYQKIGEKVTEVLEYTPAQVYVRKIVRPQYKVVGTDETSGACKITIADLPSLPIPQGNAGASLLAYMLVAKYVDHIPFDRQVKILKRSQLAVSKSTVNGWFNKSTTLLNLLYKELEKEVLDSDYLQADESPIKVQDPNKKGALHMGYDWVFRSPVKRLVLFRYDKSRGKHVPKTVLNNFNGTLQTDGYAGYVGMQTNGDITLVACMAHARRKFKDALKVDPKRADYVLTQMQRLYKMERKARERGIEPGTLKRYRYLYAKPILDDMESWLKGNINQVLPQSAIGKAVNYTYSLWPRLRRYIDDGRYEIDNNLIENSIRPLALGRKNYLFAGSHEAAQKAAMMYSFFASCKVCDVNPLEWLTVVLNKIPGTKTSQLRELLPAQWKARNTDLGQ